MAGESEVKKVCKAAKEASYAMMKVLTEQKNEALSNIAEAFDRERAAIIEANKADVDSAVKKGITKAFIDRLTLNDSRIDSMIGSVNDVIALPDPVGQVTSKIIRPNGLEISKVRMPIGVVGFIFEARPNVNAEVAALIIKSGNTVVMKGGSDAAASNLFLAGLIKEAIRKAGLPSEAFSVLDSTDREQVKEMLTLKEYIDVIIPRGGSGLVNFVVENSVIPVIRHDMGVCHTYVDRTADTAMAVSIAYNAKVQRPSVCNAMETLLVHKDIARVFLPAVKSEYDKAGVELRGCDETKKIIPGIRDASEEDWYAEYNDLILSIRTVDSFEEAVCHINKYGSHHSDAIVTSDAGLGERFLREVDSAACYVNASTRFTDGNEFGLGAEMGISNQKLHVRGPLALEGLTSEKFIIRGTGQIRG